MSVILARITQLELKYSSYPNKLRILWYIRESIQANWVINNQDIVTKDYSLPSNSVNTTNAWWTLGKTLSFEVRSMIPEKVADKMKELSPMEKVQFKLKMNIRIESLEKKYENNLNLLRALNYIKYNMYK